MAAGQLRTLDVPVERDESARVQQCYEEARADERLRLRARLQMVVTGLEALADPTGDPADLIAIADVQARRLRVELESADSFGELVSFDEVVRQACEDEREWVRGFFHDTALQMLEYIAGDALGTGLDAEQIANVAAGAARDLRRWTDAVDDCEERELLQELELVTAQARKLDPRVRLVVGKISDPPSGDQAAAIAGAVREAVNNARKHSQAENVIVRVERSEDGSTTVTVTDDGVGIDLDALTRSSGLGVAGSIVGRMRRAGGDASLERAPGGGTRVTLLTKQGA
jgi:anti-sigma regulatory factor (Ser/Thr protein kinase)